ncbi:MAG: LysR substrate-binding domain-containing protein, partial [Shimia sp.]
FSQRLLIGRQIHAHLRRVGVPTTSRYEFDDTASVLRLVSEGHGWAILTPVMFSRVHRFEERVDLRPVPFAAFSRRIVLLSSVEVPASLTAAIAAMVREHAEARCIRPALLRFPWLEGALQIEGLTP